MKFLIVDDNPVMRQTLGKIVQQNGDEIIECEDGRDALRMYLLHRPDWVLMDISMRVVNGIEATEQIIKAEPDARIVIVTDYSDRFFRKAAEDAGAVAFIAKDNLKDIRRFIDEGKVPSH